MNSPAVLVRPVTSFVRRSPRMNDSQRAAWQRLGARYLVDGLPRHQMQPLFVPQPPLDLAALFGREAPLLVEIGAGSGENLAALAAARPSWNLLGFEVYEKVLGSTMLRLDRVGALNVKLVAGDAVSGLEYLLRPGSVAELHTWFPDPWHKTRHAKRRLISAGFAQLAASRLATGAHWRLATDWDDYATHIAAVFACPEVAPLFDGGPCERDRQRPLTKFEARAKTAGRAVSDFKFVRTDVPTNSLSPAGQSLA